MIRITENFTLRRVAGQLAVSVADGYHVVAITLTPAQARYAAAAFEVAATMLDDSDVTDIEPEALKLEEAA